MITEPSINDYILNRRVQVVDPATSSRDVRGKIILAILEALNCGKYAVAKQLITILEAEE